MPVLKNARHETFAQALAQGKTADEAYAQAGYKPHRGNASTLRANQNITRRVDEIRNRVAEKAEWTAADRLRMLANIAEKTQTEDPRVAVSAIAEANKMQGSHAPAKRELSGPNGGPIQTVDLTKLTEEQIDALEALYGPLALTGGDDEGDQTGEG